MRTVFFSLLVLTASLTVARAERYTLADGSELVGAPVAETATTLTVMTEDGEVELALADVRAVAPAEVSSGVERRAAKARLKAFKSARRRAGKLLSAYGRAEPEEQPALEAELRGLPAAALVDPLGEALDDRRPATRALAVRLLQDNPTRPQAVDELLKAAMVSDDAELRAAAHAAASQADPERAEAVYQAVAVSRTKPKRRLAAVDYLGQMNRRSALPKLICVLEYVRSEIRTALATAAGTREVPLDLGSSGAAATNVPVELPQIQLFEVNTTISVPTLRVISGRTVDALRGLSGEDFGDDPGAWQQWWDREGQHLEPR